VGHVLGRVKAEINKPYEQLRKIALDSVQATEEVMRCVRDKYRLPQKKAGGAAGGASKGGSGVGGTPRKQRPPGAPDLKREEGAGGEAAAAAAAGREAGAEQAQEQQAGDAKRQLQPDPHLHAQQHQQQRRAEGLGNADMAEPAGGAAAVATGPAAAVAGADVVPYPFHHLLPLTHTGGWAGCAPAALAALHFACKRTKRGGGGGGRGGGQCKALGMVRPRGAGRALPASPAAQCCCPTRVHLICAGDTLRDEALAALAMALQPSSGSGGGPTKLQWWEAAQQLEAAVARLHPSGSREYVQHVEFVYALLAGACAVLAGWWCCCCRGLQGAAGDWPRLPRSSSAKRASRVCLV
jgi:hypothetical protein